MLDDEKNYIKISDLAWELSFLGKKLLNTRDLLLITVNNIRNKEDDEKEIFDIEIDGTAQEIIKEIRNLGILHTDIRRTTT